MKRWSLVVAAAVAAVGLGAEMARADGFQPITSESEFQQLVVGKKLWIGDDHVTIKKNGRLTGKFGGKSLKGAWAWRDGFWCRTIDTHAKNTDCQLWEVNGNQFRVTRDRGKGRGFVYEKK